MWTILVSGLLPHSRRGSMRGWRWTRKSWFLRYSLGSMYVRVLTYLIWVPEECHLRMEVVLLLLLVPTKHVSLI